VLKQWRAVERLVIARDRAHGGGESVICVDTTASYKQNKMSGESSAWDWIHIDEPIPEGQWIGASRGLVDRDGKAWFTCTPLDQTWINDKFVPSQRLRLEGKDSYSQELVFENTKVTTWMMTGSMDDNPHNTPKSIAKFMLDLESDPASTACRRHGIPLAMSGMVYKEFQPAVHVYHSIPKGWSAADVPPRNYTIRLAIDPHPRIPTAVLFIATSPLGISYVYHEIFRDMLIPDVCDEILARTKGYEIQDCLIDPLANTRNPVDDSCMKDEFFRKGVWCVEATKAKSEGILKVREFLRERIGKSSTNPEGYPGIFFGAHLTRTLWEFDHWVYDTVTNKPMDGNDHMMENLYRLALTQLEYVTTSGTAIPKLKEQSAERFIDAVLRTDSQTHDDFQEYDAEENEVFPTTRSSLSSVRTIARRAARNRHHDAY